jgi:photosystem II stability/assembly factor-like uncharacterized protein
MKTWLLVIAFALGSLAISHAGVNKWTSGGPYGGTFSDFAFDSVNSNIIIASTRQYADYTRPIFRSLNGGSSWQRTVVTPSVPSCVGDDPFDDCFEALVKTDPFQPHSFFASGGFSHTTDAGKSWQALNDGCCVFSDFEIDVRNKGVIYGVSVISVAGYHPEISKSTDGGMTWNISSRLYGGFPNDVANIEIDSGNDQRVYALSEAGKGLRTENGGKTWIPMNHGNPISSVSFAMVADPLTAKTLYVGGRNGILKSTDAGESWAHLPCGCRYITSLAVDHRNPQLMWATGWQVYHGLGAPRGEGGNVYRSTDGGMRWETFPTLNSANWEYIGVAIDPKNSNKVYVGSIERGIYRTLDGGGSWQVINHGINDMGIGPVESGARRGEVVAAGFLSQSLDAGKSWHYIANFTEPASNFGNPVLIEDVKLHANDPNLIVLTGAFPHALQVSTDAGRTWQKRGPLSPYGEQTVSALDPHDAKTIFFSFSNDFYGTRHLARSTDLGVTWNLVEAGITERKAINALEISSAFPSTIYAGTQAGTLYASTDYGKTWKNRSAGLSHCGGAWIDCYGVVQIRSSPINANLLLVRDFEQLYRSVDGGVTWTRPAIPNVWDVRFNPSRPSEAVAVGTFGQIFISSDEGATWKEFTNRKGLTGSTGYGNILIPSWDPKTIFVGTTRGVFSFTRK